MESLGLPTIFLDSENSAFHAGSEAISDHQNRLNINTQYWFKWIHLEEVYSHYTY